MAPIARIEIHQTDAKHLSARAGSRHAVDEVPWIGAHPTEIVMRHGLIIIARIKIEAVSRLHRAMIDMRYLETTAGATIGLYASRRDGWRHTQVRRHNR
jgi:hypothetical protein